MRGKQSGINYGIRIKQKHQSDIYQLIELGRYLRKRWHMEFRREWYVGFNKLDGRIERIVREVKYIDYPNYWWRNPDLLCLDKRKGLIIIEVDGAVHDREVVKTQRRNEQYKQGNVHLIILNVADVKTKGIKLTDELDWKMTNLLQGAVIGTG